MEDRLDLTSRAETAHFWFRGFHASVAPVIRVIAVGRRDLRIIDCGCGTGYNLMTLLQPYGRAFGFDLDPNAIRLARASDRPLVRADMEDIPFKSGTFDLATSFDVVQGVPDDRAALREMARVLKPGGYVVLNLTALELLWGEHNEAWDEVRRYTRESGTRLIEDAGLQVVRATYLFASLVPLILAVRSVQRLLRPFRAPRGASDLDVPPAPLNAALTWILNGEAAFTRRFSMPFDSSLLLVARKS